MITFLSSFFQRTSHIIYARSCISPALCVCSLKANSKRNTNLQIRTFIKVTEEDEVEKEKRRQAAARATKYTFISLLALFGGSVIYAFIEWGRPRLNNQGEPIEDEFSNYSLPKQYALRTWDALVSYVQTIKEPSRELLLPPPLREPYIQPPYTLTLELHGVLLHPEWTYKSGWRFKKRPFLDYFLRTCGPPHFELVVFTRDSGWMSFPLIDELDPDGYIMHRLFRDSTHYKGGVRIKDLTRLNRDLKRVIHVDWEKDACKMNPSNCFILKKYEGADDDKTLYDLCQLLRAIASQRIDDVRHLLDHYSKFEDPLKAFRENQRIMLEQQEEQKSRRPSLVSTLVKK